MNELINSKGKIVSFYSFKGGVGRTMALANVAFLAAMNDLNVLVMDWDLEAPGLHHYFRGLIEPDEMSALRSAPGILDLAWEWRSGIDAAESAEDVEQQFERFLSGEPFEELKRTVMDEFEYGSAGRLDIIPAGGDIIATPDLVEYERALASMSWNSLLDDYAGGGLIDAIRKWASSNYDLVLVDSRTGLADVAGICTMQLPNVVVLCFVLNRQNIEGVARVASAIRRQRDELKIRAVPMRVSREGTGEEADATARALRELTRPGRLDREAAEYDLRHLVIKAEPNVPFMESLSAFNETNAALDPLTANLARLTSEITGISIEVPEIPEQWRDLVKNRLAPTLSTDSYLRQLLTAEPGRAAQQLNGYLESAISTLAEGDDLADEYVAALAETAIALQQREDVLLNNEFYDTPNRAVVLLRKMYERNPEAWRPLLTQALEATLSSDLGWMGPEDEVVALDEIEELLACQEQDIEMLERRVVLRMRASRIFETMEAYVSQLAAAEDALALIKQARRIGGRSEGELQVVRFEALMQRAAAQTNLEQIEEAIETLNRLIRDAEKLEKGEFDAEAQRASSEAHYRLMRLMRSVGADRAKIAEIAFIAMKKAQPNTPFLISRFAEFSEVVLESEAPALMSAEVLRQIVMPPASGKAYLNFFRRAPAGAARLIQMLGSLLRASSTAFSEKEGAELVVQSGEIVFAILSGGTERFLLHPARQTRQGRLRPGTSVLHQLIDSTDYYLVAVGQVWPKSAVLPPFQELTRLNEDLRQQIVRMAARPTPRSSR